MDQKKIFQYLESQYDNHLRKLQEFIKQPSISPQDVGIRDCANLVKTYLDELGCRDAQLFETSGNPVVYGYYDARAPRTALIYMMYDTMPINEPGWMVPPLKGKIVPIDPYGDCLMARGAVNTKGELRAFLNGCESILAVDEEIPVNLMFVVEGEEELQSRHLPEFITAFESTLRQADLVFFPFADQDQRGKLTTYLGVKGIVYFELELDGKTWGYGPTQFDIHGSTKALVDSPVWRMIQALATMTTPDGNTIQIEGFYDKVVPPSAEDLELVYKLVQTVDETIIKDELKVERFIDDVHGENAILKYLYQPSLNIDGIWAGYIEPGTKTVLPWKITAKVDVRLVPNMQVEDVLPMIRQHLDRSGFNEIQIRKLSEGYNWAKTSVNEPAAQALLKVYHQFGLEPEIWPHLAGSAPFCMFNEPPLNLPFVLGGIGHGGRAHAPNEYLVVAEGGPTGGLVTLEKSYVAILNEFAQI